MKTLKVLIRTVCQFAGEQCSMQKNVTGEAFVLILMDTFFICITNKSDEKMKNNNAFVFLFPVFVGEKF